MMSSTVINNNPQYADRANSLDHHYREKFLERHKKRLDEIAHRESKVKKNFEFDLSVKLYENKKQIHEILSSQKQVLIDKDNQKILRKLVEIQTGKRSLIPKSQSFGQLSDFRAKSLHIGKRKLELERIERENMKIAQKIYELKPHMQVHNLEEEFSMHQRYSQSLRKLYKRKAPKHQGKHGLLPPIEDEVKQLEEKDDEKKDAIVPKERFIDVTQSLEITSTTNLIKNQTVASKNHIIATSAQERTIAQKKRDKQKDKVRAKQPSITEEEVPNKKRDNTRQSSQHGNNKDLSPYMQKATLKTDPSVLKKESKKESVLKGDQSKLEDQKKTEEGIVVDNSSTITKQEPSSMLQQL